MDDRLHAGSAGQLQDLLHGGGIVAGGDFVAGEPGLRRLQLNAGAVVKQPHVVAVGI